MRGCGFESHLRHKNADVVELVDTAVQSQQILVKESDSDRYGCKTASLCLECRFETCRLHKMPVSSSGLRHSSHKAAFGGSNPPTGTIHRVIFERPKHVTVH